MAALLEASDLRASYGPMEVLHGIAFEIQAGSILALLGANGAGKTTTLRALCAMVKTSGSVRLDGQRIDALPTEEIARRGLAHVPEGRGTFLELTTDENLRLGACTRRDAEIGADLERTYDLFPRLKERRRQQAGTLSGGEQQMLAIARALMLRPRLLLLDEPSFGLAPAMVEQIFGMLRSLIAVHRLGILLVEQNASLALSVADHACVLESGRIAISRPAAELLRDDAVRRSYLG